MDYITLKLEEKINLGKSFSNDKDVNQYENIWIQYHLFLLLGILYDLNKENIALQDQKNLLRPSLGTINQIIRKWNSEINFFENWKQYDSIFNTYITARNNSGGGHGFDFSHDNDHLKSIFKKNILDIKNTSFFSQSFNIVKIQKQDGKYIKGISYTHNGKILPWQVLNDRIELEVGELYYQRTNFIKELLGNKSIYLKISPFIKINFDDFYTFLNIEEPLTGTIKYNNLFKTEQISENYLHFERFGLIDSDLSHNKLKSVKNGMIKNDFKPNYENFIKSNSGNVLQTEIHKFLGNNSSCIATVWGHGGVGKTASIQEICDDLFFHYSKEKLEKNNLFFDYILFLSAKDRKFDYSRGKIQELEEERLTDFNDFIVKLNEFVFNESDPQVKRFYNEFNRRILIVIDDFETLSRAERERILSFTDKLDVNHYKVLISSRLAISVGKEIEKKELTDDESITFLKEILINEFESDVERFKLEEPEIIVGVHKITEGRPLFIFHFAHILMQIQDIDEAIKIDIRNSKSAVDFLYGNLYSYLDNSEQIMYKVLGLVVSKNDLLYRVNNLKYLLDFDETTFDRCLSTLWKLRIISLSDNRDFLSIYSPEILESMIQKLKEDDELHKKIDEKLASDSFIIFGSSKSIYDQKLEQAKILSKTEKKIEKVVDAFESLIRDKRFNKTEQLVAFEELIKHLLNRNIDYRFALSLCNEFSLDFRNEIKFNIIYFNTLFKSGQVQKAISLGSQVINNIFWNETTSNEYFELAGLYLKTYTHRLRNAKDNLLDNVNNYDNDDFNTMSYNHKLDMIAVSKEIEKVFLEISSTSFINLNKKQKNCLLEGFFSGAQLIRRTLREKNSLNQNRLDLFDSICDFGIKHGNGNLRDNFYNLKYQVDSNEKIEKELKDKKSSNIPQSEFALKLAEALKNKKE